MNNFGQNIIKKKSKIKAINGMMVNRQTYHFTEKRQWLKAERGTKRNEGEIIIER